MIQNRIPEISVGIVSGTGLTFTLNGEFICGDEDKRLLSGRFTALTRDGKLLLRSDNETVEAGSEITLTPSSYGSCSFTLHAVTIGVDFHWQRNEDQTFMGMLKFITPREEDFNKITASDIAGILEEVCFGGEELETLTAGLL